MKPAIILVVMISCALTSAAQEPGKKPLLKATKKAHVSNVEVNPSPTHVKTVTPVKKKPSVSKSEAILNEEKKSH